LINKLLAILIVSIFLFFLTICSSYAQSNTVSSTSSTISSNTVDKAPSTAVAPSIVNHNSDVCTFASSVAIQTQIIGLASGGSFTDEFCQMLKLSAALARLRMSVAAVAVLCEDERIFRAMWNSASYCPISGFIGEEAKALWLKKRPELAENYVSDDIELDEEDVENIIVGGIGIGGLLLLLLL
tara:strand:+ start:72 stop:623 length:552 start_codon:yes stop_codon:yes gene_type:complete